MTNREWLIGAVQKMLVEKKNLRGQAGISFQAYRESWALGHCLKGAVPESDLCKVANFLQVLNNICWSSGVISTEVKKKIRSISVSVRWTCEKIFSESTNVCNRATNPMCSPPCGEKEIKPKVNDAPVVIQRKALILLQMTTNYIIIKEYGKYMAPT